MSTNFTRRAALKGIAAVATAPLFPACVFAASGEGGNVATTAFDDGWLFLRGDAVGAHEAGFDTSAWRKVDLPHDWSIEDLPTQTATSGVDAIWQDCNCPESIGPFSRMESEGMGSTGWAVGGIGWYRKSFQTPRLPQGGRAVLLFDGVYRNSELWVNGKEAGKHAYGYTAFYFDITDLLNEKADNVLALKVSNTGKNSRWYSGSGIDRHVELITTGHVNIPVWGVHVQPSDISAASSTITVAVQLANHDTAAATAKVLCSFFDAQGQVVAKATSDKRLAAKSDGNVVLVAKVANPKLWSPDTPNRYTAEVQVSCSGVVADRALTPFGIREIKVDAENGLRINGESYKLRGACVHHDNGPLAQQRLTARKSVASNCSKRTATTQSVAVTIRRPQCSSTPATAWA